MRVLRAVTLPPFSVPTPTHGPTYEVAYGHSLPLLDIEVIEDGLIDYINERRHLFGLGELVRDPLLDDLARANRTGNSVVRGSLPLDIKDSCFLLVAKNGHRCDRHHGRRRLHHSPCQQLHYPLLKG